MRLGLKIDGLESANGVDTDPTQTREWLDSLESVLNEEGAERALFLFQELEEQLRRKGVRGSVQPFSAYRNTVSVEAQGARRD